MKESLPLALVLLLNLVYFRADILLLSLFKTTQAVGIYGFAYRFFDFFIAIPLFLSNALYPFLLQAKSNEGEFLQIAKKYFFIYFILSIILAIIGIFAAPLFSLVNKDFSLSILPFQLLLLGLPFFFATSLLQWILITKKQLNFLLTVYAVAAGINLLLNFLFIPMWSYMASAVITGLSEGLVFVLLLIKSKHILNYDK